MRSEDLIALQVVLQDLLRRQFLWRLSVEGQGLIP